MAYAVLVAEPYRADFRARSRTPTIPIAQAATGLTTHAITPPGSNLQTGLPARHTPLSAIVTSITLSNASRRPIQPIPLSASAGIVT